MAFFQANGQLCRDAWPERIGVLAQDGLNGESLPPWRVLPVTYDGLSSRVSVEDAGSNRPRVFNCHDDIQGGSQMTLFTVRLQGVVSDVNLSALGNWKGDEWDAPRAVQHITLSSGNCDAAFAPQLEGVQSLEEVVGNALSSPGNKQLGHGNRLKLIRRVFTRATDATIPSAISFTPREDPSGKARALSPRWIVDHRIRVWLQDESGRVFQAPPLAIRRGDFVDVAATVEVITLKTRKGHRQEIILSPREIVRLRSASAFRTVISRGAPSAPTTTLPNADSFTGFSFGSNHVVVTDDHESMIL